jgi:hypothetical protein
MDANHAGPPAGRHNWGGRYRLTAGDLRPENPDGALVRRSLLGDAPAQVNRREPTTVFLAVLAQPRERVFLKRIPLGLEIAEGRTYEDTKCQTITFNVVKSFPDHLIKGNKANSYHCQNDRKGRGD